MTKSMENVRKYKILCIAAVENPTISYWTEEWWFNNQQFVFQHGEIENNKRGLIMQTYNIDPE